MLRSPASCADSEIQACLVNLAIRIYAVHHGIQDLRGEFRLTGQPLAYSCLASSWPEKLYRLNIIFQGTQHQQ